MSILTGVSVFSCPFSLNACSILLELLNHFLDLLFFFFGIHDGAIWQVQYESYLTRLDGVGYRYLQGRMINIESN